MSSKSKCNRTDTYLSSSKNKAKKLSPDAQKEIIVSERATRSSKRMAENISELQSLADDFNTNEDIVSEHSKKNEKNIPTTIQRKRKVPLEEDIKDVHISKKPYKVKNPLSTIVNQTDNLLNEIYQKNENKKRKRNNTKFWESKLTGARRVSKRLTNLKIKNKILEKIEACIDSHNKLIRSKIMNRNYCKPQFTYGKLSYNKKVYPKIASSRKLTNTFTVQSKIISTIPHNSAVKKIDTGSENKLLDVTVLLTKDVPCLSTMSEVQTNIKEDSKKVIGHSQVTIAQDSKHEGTDLQNEQRSEVIGVHENKEALHSDLVKNVEEECVNTPEIITVDLELGENIVCEQSNKAEVNILSETRESSKTIKMSNLICEEVVNNENPVITSSEVSYKEDSAANSITESNTAEEVKKETNTETNTSGPNKEQPLNIEAEDHNNSMKDESLPK